MIFRESVPFIVRYRFFTENLQKTILCREGILYILYEVVLRSQQKGVEKSTPKINSIIAAEIT